MKGVSAVPGSAILVVEDDPQLRRSIVELLRSWGYRAEAASDGLEALDKIHTSEPLLILSDLKMPRMGGLELLAELRQELRSVRCIVISGEGDRAQEFQAITLGAFSFLEKPVYPERLKAEIKTCLQGRERAAEICAPAETSQAPLSKPV